MNAEYEPFPAVNVSRHRFMPERLLSLVLCNFWRQEVKEGGPEV